MDQDVFVVPINRDRGPGYIAHTGDPDHDVIRLQFQQRFGFWPKELFVEFGVTFVGPAPIDAKLDYGED